jgi:hypothetical protein
MAEPLRPLSTGALLDRAVRFYRRNVLLFAGIAVPMLLIAVISEAVSLATGATPVLPAAPVPGQLPHIDWLRFGIVLTLLILVGAIVGAYVAGATVEAVSHLELGEPATIGACYREVSRRVAPVIGVNLLVAILAVAPTMLGFLAMFLIPNVSPIAGAVAAVLVLAGIVVSFWILLRLIVVVPAVVLERPGVAGAIRRSAALTKGFMGRVLLVLLAAICVYFAISFVFSLAAGVVMVATRSLRAVQWTAFGGSCVSTLVVTPLITIAFTLLFFDLKVRKEGFDLDLLLRRGQAPSATDAASL